MFPLCFYVQNVHVVLHVVYINSSMFFFLSVLCYVLIRFRKMANIALLHFQVKVHGKGNIFEKPGDLFKCYVCGSYVVKVFLSTVVVLHTRVD